MKFFIGVILFFVAFIMIAAMARSGEVEECKNWKQYEAEARGAGLESAPWQKEQCKSYGIYLAY